MAKHEFGIMPISPKHGERFDSYTPKAYELLISVDDDYIEPIERELSKIGMYAHSVDIPCCGLVWCGITLIPPQAMDRICKIIRDKRELKPLKELIETAKRKNKYVIHYGL